MKRSIRYTVLALIGLTVIAAGFSISLLLFKLISMKEFTAPVAAIIVPFITGAFTLTGLWFANRVKVNSDKQIVYYGQEVVLKAPGGEYIIPEGDQKILRAAVDNIDEAQRFIVTPFKNPYGKPKDRPVQYGDEITLRPAPIRGREKQFVAAHEELEKIPLVVLQLAETLPDTWEQLTLVRPESNEAQHPDNFVRFDWPINLKRHNGRWVWCNYKDGDAEKRISGDLTTPPRTMENFHFENPESSRLDQFASSSLYSFGVGVVFGVLITLLYCYRQS
jgi:hypothetical protein